MSVLAQMRGHVARRDFRCSRDCFTASRQRTKLQQKRAFIELPLSKQGLLDRRRGPIHPS
jgi:hypothetical protein